MKNITIGKRVWIMSLMLFLASSTVYGVSSVKGQIPQFHQQVEVKSENNSFLRNIANILRNRRLRASSRFNQATRPTLNTASQKNETKETKQESLRKPTSSLYSRLRSFRNRRAISSAKKSSVQTSPVKNSSSRYLQHLRYRNARTIRRTKTSTPSTVPTKSIAQKTINTVTPTQQITTNYSDEQNGSTSTNNASLVIEEIDSILGKILVENENDVEIMRLQLSSSGEEVLIQEFYFQNNLEGNLNWHTNEESRFDNGGTFKLYSESSNQVLGTTIPSGGILHFDLSNNNIVIPVGENINISIKVDVNEITPSDTSRPLQLDIDTTYEQNGTVAINSVNGEILNSEDITIGNIPEPNLFLAYKTKIELKTLPSPTTPLKNGPNQEVFRFQVTPNTAGSATLGRISLIIDSEFSLSNMIVKNMVTPSETYPVDRDFPASYRVAVLFNKLEISAPQTYIVYADISGSSAGQSVLSKIYYDSMPTPPYTAPNNFYLNTPSPTTFWTGVMWSDNSNPNADNDYLNGYLLYLNTTETLLYSDGTNAYSDEDQSINLHEGWNIISLYVDPDNADVESVFSELISSGNLVQVKDLFNVFDPNLPAFLNTLDTIEGAQAYWVKVTQDTVLNIEGDMVNIPHVYNLNTGLNLIGYPLNQEANMFCILHELNNAHELVSISKEPLEGNTQPELILENGQWNTNNLTEKFKPGEGYYLEVNTPTELEIINTTPCF